jgi:hypothetical protein
MSRIFGDVHKMIMRLVALNAIFDVISIPFWVYLPSLQNAQSQSILTVDPSTAIMNAAVAAAWFAVAFYGIMKWQKWGPILAIAITLAQRVIGFFMFQLNVGIAAEIVWSTLIIYFAYRALKQPRQPKLETPREE